jgi:putative transposase
MSINYVNAEHVHALIDLPSTMSIKDVMQLLKGGLSHWINAEQLVRGRFSWGRGYAALSVSHSHHQRVAEYIATQEEHHHRRTFAEEYEDFVRLYGMQWRVDS